MQCVPDLLEILRRSLPGYAHHSGICIGRGSHCSDLIAEACTETFHLIILS